MVVKRVDGTGGDGARERTKQYLIEVDKIVKKQSVLEKKRGILRKDFHLLREAGETKSGKEFARRCTIV